MTQRRGHGAFGVNVWPPMVDALALILAAFVVVFLVGAVRQAAAKAGCTVLLKGGDTVIARVYRND